MTDSLRDIIYRLTELRNERATKVAEHKEWLASNQRLIDALTEKQRMIGVGLDAGRIDRGRRILRIVGNVNDVIYGQHTDSRSGNRNARPSAVNDAMLDLTVGGRYLVNSYFGVKNYAGFGDQRSDAPYGHGPRHGNTVFSIGLQPEIRDRLRGGGELISDEIEDALYLLSTLSVAQQTATHTGIET